MIAKNKKIYVIENEEGVCFSVQKAKSETVLDEGKREYDECIVFLVEGIDPDGDLKIRHRDEKYLSLTLSMDEAEKLGIALLALVEEGIFTDKSI
jgi:hypothetical protein